MVDLPGGLGTSLIVPTLVLEAFAIELLLKSLLLLERKEPGKTHELDKLFRKLHFTTQASLISAWDAGPKRQMTQIATELDLPTELPLALEKCSTAFSDLRYAHEDPNKCVFYLGKLPRLLQDYIAATNSDWVRWTLVD